MRLIDADALKQECMYIDDIPAVTEHDIDKAPTIPAIPVEWIRKKREVAIWQFAGAFDWLLSEWQKEQEAR